MVYMQSRFLRETSGSKAFNGVKYVFILKLLELLNVKSIYKIAKQCQNFFKVKKTLFQPII